MSVLIAIVYHCDCVSRLLPNSVILIFKIDVKNFNIFIKIDDLTFDGLLLTFTATFGNTSIQHFKFPVVKRLQWISDCVSLS